MHPIARSLAALLLLASVSIFAAPPPDLDGYVARAMSAAGAPAFAVAVVENGTTTLAKGYGIRKMGEAAQTNARTIFPIGSNTKQFTATALALLVDEGRLNWEDKVVSRLPGFQMFDPYTTGEMTVRDLLVHRSGLGLGAGDLMFLPRTDRSRQDVVEALRHLKPARGFRSGYAYDNVLYVTAGRLLEAVTQQSWESFIRARILMPLGMKDALPTYAELKPGRNFAWPHVRAGGPSWAVGGEVAALKTIAPVTEIAAPTGGILASAEDMAKWLAVQLDRGGLPGGKRLFSEAQSAALWRAETLMPLPPTRTGPLAITDPQFQSYALGFVVRDYRGHKIITHGGGWIGGISTTVLIPDLKIGFAVMTNSMEISALRSVELRLLDHYLGHPDTEWTPLVQEAFQAKADQALAILKAQTPEAGVGAAPSLPLSKYAGVYRDPWYGTVSIRENGKGLSISFDRSPGMAGALEPVRHDTFRTRWSDPLIEDAYATFTLKPDGSVAHFVMKAISPLADFSFDYQDLLLTPEKKN